jgi:hypothetical protein
MNSPSMPKSQKTLFDLALFCRKSIQRATLSG